MSANDKTGVGSGSGEWGTPPALFNLLDRRWKFTYDRWASHENALTQTYSTTGGTFIKWDPGRQEVGGVELFSHRSLMTPGILKCERLSPDTGMSYSNPMLREFGNPPYTRGLIDKCIDTIIRESEVSECIAQLVPAATETEWFQRAYEHFGTPTWLPRRVKFIHPMTRCRTRSGEECKHELGAPCDGPPSGMCIFESNIPKKLWLEALK